MSSCCRPRPPPPGLLTIRSCQHTDEWTNAWNEIVTTSYATPVHVFVEGVFPCLDEATRPAPSVHLHCLDPPEIYRWVSLCWAVTYLLEAKALQGQPGRATEAKRRARERWTTGRQLLVTSSTIECPPKDVLVAHILDLWPVVPRPGWPDAVAAHYQEQLQRFCALPSYDRCLTILESTLNQDLRNYWWVETVQRFTREARSCVLLVGNAHVTPLWQLFAPNRSDPLRLLRSRLVFV